MPTNASILHYFYVVQMRVKEVNGIQMTSISSKYRRRLQSNVKVSGTSQNLVKTS